MDAEDAVVDDGGEGEVVEDVGAVPPDVERAVLPQALIIEPVDLRDLPALVVPSDQRHQVRIAHLVGEEEEEGLDAVEATVYEIAKEEVADARYVSPVLEELEQIVELAMDISADGDWGVHTLYVALFD